MLLYKAKGWVPSMSIIQRFQLGLGVLEFNIHEDTNNILEEFWEVELSSLLNGCDDGGKHLLLLRPLVLHQNQQLPQGLLVLLIGQRYILVGRIYSSK